MSNRLTHFEISLHPNVQFYANGRQQARIAINVRKVNAQGVQIPLTQSEINSIRVVRFSSNLNENTLPIGWEMDIDKNEYDFGLVNRTFIPDPATNVIPIFSESAIKGMVDNCECKEKTEENAPVDSNPEAFNNNVPQRVYRFIRASTTGVNQLMGAMMLDAGTPNQTPITTNMNVAGGHNFQSSVNLTPQPSLNITPQQLDINVRSEDPLVLEPNSKHWTNILREVHIYKWRLPLNLRIIGPTCLVPRSNVPKAHEGLFFLHYQARNEDTFHNDHETFMAAMLSNSVKEVEDSTFGPETKCVGFGYSFHFPVDITDREFGAAILYARGCADRQANTRFTSLVDIQLTDNFGNTHSFRATHSRDFRSIVIN